VESTLDLAELDANIGRLFMAGIPGTRLDMDTKVLIHEHCLGGVILFGRNIEDPEQLATLCNDLQDCAMKQHGIPLFLAIDQEGGPVARLKEPFTQFQGNSAIGNDPEAPDKAKMFAQVTAKEMHLVGLNMNLAPVLDVRRGDPEQHLMGRTFSDDAQKVAFLGCIVIKVLQEKGIMAVAKHFPGLGKAPLDPHHELPTIEVNRGEIEKTDLTPFREAIAAEVSSIMTSHAVYPALESGVPATLSRKILTGILRETLGFKGLVITDDLEMGAIDKKWGVAHGACQAFQAGADILLICQDQTKVLESMTELRTKLIRGEISSYRLYQSLDRLMRAKSRFLKKRTRVSIRDVRSYFA
jgi:beta-N-acetylhexosaminidase